MQKVSWSGHLFACNHLALLDASARANSGQCALGAPFLKGDEIVDGLKQIWCSKDCGWRKICPRYISVWCSISEGMEEKVKDG